MTWNTNRKNILNIRITDGHGKQLATYSVEDIKGIDDAPDRAIKAIRNEFKQKRSAYNLSKMQVGESKDIYTDSPRRVISAASNLSRRRNRKYQCRTHSNGMVRVKRLADPVSEAA